MIFNIKNVILYKNNNQLIIYTREGKTSAKNDSFEIISVSTFVTVFSGLFNNWDRIFPGQGLLILSIVEFYLDKDSNFCQMHSKFTPSKYFSPFSWT